MATIGYNINSGACGIPSEAAADVRLANADFNLIMTVPQRGIDGAAEIATMDWWQGQIPGSKLVWRTFNSLQGDWSVYPKNTDYINLWKSQNRPQYVRDDPVNEPSLWYEGPQHDELHRRYVERTVDLLNRAADINVQVAAGAFSVGTPHETPIQKGIYDPLIKAVIEGNHYFSFHLYGTAIPELGDMLPFEHLLKEKEVAQYLSQEKWPFGEAHKYWFLRRPDWFMHRAKELLLPEPPVLVTESFIDLIPTAVPVLNQISRNLKDSRYMYDLKGMIAWKKYIEAAFPGIAFDQALSMLTEHVATKVFWPSYFKGIMLFAANWLWDTPQGTNYLNPILDTYRRTFLPAINKKIRETVPMAFPDVNSSEWVDVIITASNKNARSIPSTNGDVVYVVNGSVEAKRFPTPAPKTPSSKYTWYAYQIKDGNFIRQAWIAEEVISWTPKPIAPENKYIIEFKFTVIVGETSLQDFINIQERILADLKTASLLE